jgi:hypothetical protein
MALDRSLHIKHSITLGCDALRAELGEHPSQKDLELALRFAIQSGEDGLPVERMLLEQGVSPDIQLPGFVETPTLIMWAATNGAEASLRLLLEFKVDLSQVNAAGNNILHQSAGEADYRALINILSSDPGPLLLNAKNLAGASPLDKAILSGERECILLLLVCGATYERDRVEELISCSEVMDLENWVMVREFMDRDDAEKARDALDEDTIQPPMRGIKTRL